MVRIYSGKKEKRSFVSVARERCSKGLEQKRTNIDLKEMVIKAFALGTLPCVSHPPAVTYCALLADKGSCFDLKGFVISVNYSQILACDRAHARAAVGFIVPLFMLSWLF